MAKKKSPNALPSQDGVYRIFNASTYDYNITVINGASVAGTRLNMQAYASFVKSQFAKTVQVIEDATKGLVYAQIVFQCNGEGAVSPSTLYPSVSGGSALAGEEVQLRTIDAGSIPAENKRINWYLEPDGNSMTINGESYETYLLVAAAP